MDWATLLVLSGLGGVGRDAKLHRAMIAARASSVALAGCHLPPARDFSQWAADLEAIGRLFGSAWWQGGEVRIALRSPSHRKAASAAPSPVSQASQASQSCQTSHPPSFSRQSAAAGRPRSREPLQPGPVDGLRRKRASSGQTDDSQPCRAWPALP